ncbi:MAG TPA: TonB-dependent receptor [Chitinophagaceae bacterium]|nr:TonB-dependent receptor [Chitinophagaceae bacterium]
MKKNAFLLLLAVCCKGVYGQSDTLAEKNMEEIVVYSNKFAEKKKNLAQKIDVVTARTIARFNAQNTGDLLINTGNVFVQKSQQGGSSPVLRGFEASRVLLVIDGVRMNNAIYRSGHLQNSITVDQNMLERVEVLYGPASTIYGSDALGGVIHFRTKSPVLSHTNKLLTRGTAFTRYSSANKEKTGHADVSIGGKKFGWLTSFTYSDFGDMKMGNNYPKKYLDFGRRSSYIETVGGIDYVVKNDDDRVQKFSGYSQWDITNKFLWEQTEKITHSLNLQFSNTSDIPRYDRLQDIRNFGGTIGTTLRFAEWYYGPQKRLLAAYELNAGKVGFFDMLKANINYQDVEESRQQREYRRYDRFDSRREHIKVAGFTIDGRKTWGQNELNMGIDGQLNNLTSVADRTNLLTGAVSKLDSRYPNGKNRMNFLGAYAQHLLKLKNGKIILNDGVRFQYVSLHSTIADNSFFNLPVTDIKQTPFAVTGNLGLVFMPDNTFRLSTNLSSGFRAPNIDDMARIFESSSALKRVVIPNADIQPEYTYNFDLGFTFTIPNKLRLELTTFYTFFRNAIALAPFQLNGQDSILYNGVNSAVIANQNVNKANIRGINARLKIEFSPKVNWDNTISQTYGRYITTNGSKKPLDHIPPVFGRSSLQFTFRKFSTELFALFNGWKKIRDFNPDGEDNGQYATPDGMPGWITINWRAETKLTSYLSLQWGIENIFDRNYRYFASGFSAAGRNYFMAFRASW